MRLTIFGSGYVGLVTGACFAETGNNVLCVESAFHFQTRELFLHEALRVLKPGGWLLLTFYSERVWRATEHAEAVARGEFVFATSAKLKGLLPDWYHTALQNRDRIVASWSESFANVTYLSERFGDQDLVAGKKSIPD